MDGASIFVRLPGDRRPGGSCARGQCSVPPGSTALSYGRIDLLVGLWHPGHLVLALHDPLRPHHRRSGSAAPVLHSCSGERASSSFRSCSSTRSSATESSEVKSHPCLGTIRCFVGAPAPAYSFSSL